MNDIKFTPSKESEHFYDELLAAQDDEKRVNLLLNIAKIEVTQQPESVIALCQRGLGILQQQTQLNSAHIAQKAELYYLLSYGHRFFNNHQDALASALKGVAFLDDGETTLHAKLYARLGSSYWHLGDNAEGFSFLVKGLQIAQKAGAADEVDLIISNLASYYATNKNYEKSVAYFEQLLLSFRQQNQLTRMMVILNNLSVGYYFLGDYEKAIEAGEEAIEITDTLDPAHVHGIEIHGFAHNNVGNAFVELGRFAQAERYFTIALAAFPKMGGNKLGELYSWRGLGNLFLRQGQFVDAIDHFQMALEAAESINSKQEQLACLERLAAAYERTHDAEQALRYFKQYHDLYTAVFSQESADKINRLEVLHRTETAEREARQLQEENIRLEKRVIERTKALEQSLAREQDLGEQLKLALEKEAELSRLKSQIISTVSHEFRTPLAVIQTSTELLIKYFQRYKPEKRQQIYQRIHDSIFYLTDLLQDMSLVDTTNREPLRAQPTAMPFNTFCQKLATDLYEETGAPENLHVHMATAQTQTVAVDYGKLKQIVFNLLTNALKYTPAQEPIDISLRLEPSHIVVVVADKGIGIPADDIENIWDLFYRAANVHTHRGMGLGLYIVQKLVRVLDGTVAVHSEGNGKGSQFMVRIPVNPAQAQTGNQDGAN